MHLLESGVKRFERLSQRGIQRVHGAVALGYLVTLRAADSQLDHSLGSNDTLHAALYGHAVAGILKARHKRAGTPLYQEMEGGVSRFKLPALVFKAADLRQHFVEQCPIVLDIRMRDERGNVGPTRQLAHENPPGIAHGLGRDMFVRFCCLRHGVNMHPTLMRKRAGSHERLAGAVRHIRRFIDKARQFCEMLRAPSARNLSRRNTLPAPQHAELGKLEGKIRDH